MRTVLNRERLASAAPWVMVAVLACSNLLLIRQNLRLRGELDGGSDALAERDVVEPFLARTLDGSTFNVQYSGVGPKRVLLYFSPACTYSDSQFAYWKQLLGDAGRGRFEVIGAVPDDVGDRSAVESYLRSFGVGTATKPLRVVKISGSVRRAYKLFATPTTLVVANDGRVEKVWKGKWESQELAEAGRLFDLDFSANGMVAPEAQAGVVKR